MLKVSPCFVFTRQDSVMEKKNLLFHHIGCFNQLLTLFHDRECFITTEKVKLKCL